MRLAAVLTALLTTTACTLEPLAPAEGPLQLSGLVTELDGLRNDSPIAGARVRVVSGVNLDRSVTSDGDGRFLLDDLESGRFILEIAADGYIPATPVILIGPQSVDATFALKAQ
jgi:hypothetical protein